MTGKLVLSRKSQIFTERVECLVHNKLTICCNVMLYLAYVSKSKCVINISISVAGLKMST